jgi:hypothetical protein
VVSLEDVSHKKINKLKGMLVRRALPLLVEHPIRATVRAMISSVIAFLLTVVGIAVAVIVVFAVWLNSATTYVSGNNSALLNKIVLWSAYTALAIVGIVVLAFIAATVVSAVRAWYRVGNSLAVMLGFVALFFFSSDAWRIVGDIRWWRLIALICLCSIISFPVLYRKAIPAVQAVDKERLDNPDQFVKAVQEDFATDIVKEIVDTCPPRHAAQLSRAALFNLRAVVAVLALGRILVSGLLLSFALFVISLIVINQGTTQSLMNGKSLAVAGWSKTLQLGGYQFFVSEALIKVALSVGGLAVAYFVVVVNTQPSQDQAAAEDAVFLRKVLTLWSCYRTLA